MAGEIGSGFGGGGPAACSAGRSLALLMSFLGAKLGASVGRRRATSGHIGPGLPQVNGSYGDAGPHPATARACMACRRSGVRIPLAPHFSSSKSFFDTKDDL